MIDLVGNKLPDLSGFDSHGSHVATADGAVRYVSKAIDLNVLEKLFTKAAGRSLRGSSVSASVRDRDADREITPVIETSHLRNASRGATGLRLATIVGTRYDGHLPCLTCERSRPRPVGGGVIARLFENDDGLIAAIQESRYQVKCRDCDVWRRIHEPQLKYPTLENQPPMHGKWSHRVPRF